MKILRNIFTLTGALTFVCLAFSVLGFASPPGGISWISYEQGVSLAEKEQKKLLISFYSDKCAYCKVMYEETFNDPAIISYINKYFIPVRVNSEKERKTAQAFNIRGLPDTWFMSETKEIIGHRAGFITAETMIQLLKYINSGSYKNMSLKSFIEKK